MINAFPSDGRGGGYLNHVEITTSTTWTVPENVKEILECDLQLEQIKHTALIEAIKVCEAESDFVSREMLLKLKDENEEHTDWLEMQLNLIGEMGLENFIQQSVGEND